MDMACFESLQIGDVVKIVEQWVPTATGARRWNSDGGMDKWLGKTMTVRTRFPGEVQMLEDQDEFCGGWHWYPEMIECIVSEDNDDSVDTAAGDLFSMLFA